MVSFIPFTLKHLLNPLILVISLIDVHLLLVNVTFQHVLLSLSVLSLFLEDIDLINSLNYSLLNHLKTALQPSVLTC